MSREGSWLDTFTTKPHYPNLADAQFMWLPVRVSLNSNWDG